MKILLDTHVILWALHGEKFPKEIKHLILNRDNEIFYSTVSMWEIEIKHQKIDSFKLSGQQFSSLCYQNYLENISITNNDVACLSKLRIKDNTIVHNDPFDKMLLSQAINNNMLFITHDKKFNKYDHDNIVIF